MEDIRKKSLPLFLQIIHFRRVTQEEVVTFHNDMLSTYINHANSSDYELIRDCAKSCLKIVHLMTLEDSWFRSRSVLYWTLYILNKSVISVELADDLILAAFRSAFARSGA